MAGGRAGRHRVPATGAWASVGVLGRLVLPVVCGGCGAEDDRWCSACSAWLGGPAVRHAPTPCPPGLPPLWAVAPYAGPVRTAVVALKDRDRADLAAPLGRALGRALLGALHGMHPAGPRSARSARQAADVADAAHVADVPHVPHVLVVPAPSSAAARARRGADPVGALARHAVATARGAGWPVVLAPALVQRRGVADQAGLGHRQRADNLAGHLAVPGRWRDVVAGARVLLVDDVVTTGATLAEAARAVRACGARPVGAATVAATRRRPSLSQPPYLD